MSILHSTCCALVRELIYRGLLHQLTSSADLRAPSHRKREREREREMVVAMPNTEGLTARRFTDSNELV